MQVIEITNRGFPTVVALLLVTAAYVVAVIAVGRLQGKSLPFDPVKLTAGVSGVNRRTSGLKLLPCAWEHL